MSYISSKFPGENVPNRTTISRLVEEFQETGSVLNKRKSGRPRVLTKDTLDKIGDRIEQSPRKYLKRLAYEG